ncbi:sugar ABC transporter ATP-binding protein [Paludibacterium yongneupense]|uniref:sugar ABC transporter ATP-binding protein n=1 Tax=Paludibacterium yongneupense TaxID=400061 RepID=UPI000427BDD6|nr:sugar ABC transporter ATP-binding protein [Paludibacterium yongneupense]
MMDPNTPSPTLLKMEGIVKRFGSQTVVNDVSLDLPAGKIVALLGENGAGKSTFIKVLAGVYKNDGGRILFKGREIASAAALHTRGEQPISFIHQDLGLIEWMTVAENMALIMGFPRRFGLIDWATVSRKASEALAEVGIDLDPQARVFELSRSEKSLLAIARAIAVDAEVLVLDEPTASLPADDVRHLFTVLQRLRERKVGMIYVTHRLDEVMEIADEICVMRDGFRVAGGAISQYTMQTLVGAIVGGEPPADLRRPTPERAPTLLRLERLVVGDTGPVSFSLRRGEMLALAGLRGAGQEEIGRCLFGMRTAAHGNIVLDERRLSLHSPHEAIQAGISLVAGDRLGESLVMSMSVRENLVLNPCTLGHPALSAYGTKQEARSATEMAERFDVRPRNVEIDVSALSGGNQQKVVMARWLNMATPLLILEDPTAGVDVGARSDIYAILNQALDNGISIIVVSSDFEEIALICDHALVFNRGHVVGELCGDDVSFANLLELACAGGVAAAEAA